MALFDKVAVITGGASGIGRAVALEFAKNGATLVIGDINENEGEQTLKLIAQQNLPRRNIAIFQRCDVTQKDELTGFMNNALSHYGKIDIWCNNAGIARLPEGFFENNESVWKPIIDINFVSVILGTQIAIQALKKNSHGGVIINTSSLAAMFPAASLPVYSAVKAGIVNFTRALASLYESDKIRVCAICPSFTNTPLLSQFDAKTVEAVRELAGGILDVEDVAKAFVELALDSHNKGGGAVLQVTPRGSRYWPPQQHRPKL